MIAADVLFYIRRASQLGPPFKVITLPNQEIFLNAQFASDIAIVIVLDEDNFDNIYHRLQF